MASEIELKYAPPRGFSESMLWNDREIKLYGGEKKEIKMQTDYLDTSDGMAKSLGITLRRRIENGESILYAKCGKSRIGALSIRGEWSVSSEDVENAAKLLADEGAPTEQLFGRELEVITTISFTRRECEVSPRPGTVILLSYDEGVLGDYGPFSEIELELSEGECEDLMEFGERLAGRLDLKPEARSKYARALEGRKD